MLNLKSFEEFENNLILENQILFSQRKEDAPDYKKFSNDVIHRILGRENVDDFQIT